MTTREFTCEGCNQVFVTDTPEEEVKKDHEKTFPEHKGEAIAVVCDDCYKKILKTLGVESN